MHHQAVPIDESNTFNKASEPGLLIQPTAAEALGARRFYLMRVSFNDLCPTTLNLSITQKGKEFAARCSAAKRNMIKIWTFARILGFWCSAGTKFAQHTKYSGGFNCHDPTNPIHHKLADQSVGRLPTCWLTADYQHQKAVALRPAIVRT